VDKASRLRAVTLTALASFVEMLLVPCEGLPDDRFGGRNIFLKICPNGMSER
jgi:hypothetical protein